MEVCQFKAEILSGGRVKLKINIKNGIHMLDFAGKN